MKILVTGGCGFIGHHFCEHIIKNTDMDLVVLDRLSYASMGFNRLRDVSVYDDKRVRILSSDFTQPIECGLTDEIGQVDYIVHIGAETHVDRSIDDAVPFVLSNVLGTTRVLDFARTQKKLKKMIYFSTDEVFGPAPDGKAFHEWAPYRSSNPYAASKAGGEEMCLAYANTHKVPVMITHTMNVFGERQHPEKFIPMVMKKVMAGETVTIHSNAEKTKAGSRFYIHARNVSDAIMFLIDKGIPGDKYNIVGEREVDNLEMARFIAGVIKKPLHYEMVDFHSSRPGHDLRYALDGSKMNDMGWKIPVGFEQSLHKSIQWMLDHPKWLKDYAGSQNK